MGFFRRKLPREDFAEAVAATVRDTLASPGFATTVVEPLIAETSSLTAEEVSREAAYLALTANNFALGQHIRDPQMLTRVQQHCTDRVVVALHGLGFWPQEESPRLANQYTMRKEEIISSVEEMTAAAPLVNPYLFGTAAAMVVCKRLFGGDVPELSWGPLAKIFADQWVATSNLLNGVRLV